MQYLGSPAPGHGAGHQFLEHSRPGPGGVLLVPGRKIGRAHDAAGGGQVGAAFADPGAAANGVTEVAVVLAVPEAEPGVVGVAPGRAQVRVQRPRAHDDTGVQHVVGVEDSLDRAERGDRGLGVHGRQQFAAGAAVAVLAGHRPAVGRRQLGRGLQEIAERAGAAGRAEVEVDPDVHAAVAEVPVRQPVQLVLAQQRSELTQVGAETLGRHGRVLPAGVIRAAASRAGDQARSVLPDPPQRRGLALVAGDDVRRRAGHGDKLARSRIQLGLAVAGKLDHQQPAARRQVGHRTAGRADQVDDPGVQALDRDRVESEQPRRGVGRLSQCRVAEHDQHRAGRRLPQPQRRPGGDGARALGADERLRDIETALGQQMLQRVAGHLAAEAAQLGPDHSEVLAGDRPEAGQDG